MKSNDIFGMKGRIIIRVVPDDSGERETPHDGTEFILFFPDEAARYGYVNSYMAIGMHSEASIAFYYDTLPIKEDRKTAANLFIRNYVEMVRSYSDMQDYKPRVVSRWVR